MDLLGNSVLGYSWEASSDIMGVKVKVNLSKKKRKIAEHPDLTVKDLEKQCIKLRSSYIEVVFHLLKY